MSMEKLKEAATTVINRRLNIDDIMYYVNNMDPNRYQHQNASGDFRGGYLEFRNLLLRNIHQGEKAGAANINQFAKDVKTIGDNIANQLVGDGRFALQHPSAWSKGVAYAYQELTRFLEGDDHNQGPQKTPVSGKTV